MRILILEDSDERIKQFKHKLMGHKLTICKSSKTCIDILTNEVPFDYIMLDHDLGDNFTSYYKDTGYEVAKWITENKNKAPTKKIFIHSLNTNGAVSMLHKLLEANIATECVPFLWEKLAL